MKCINCGAELGAITTAFQCPYCGTVNSPFNNEDDILDAEELIYEKPAINENGFRSKLRDYLSGIDTLPLDFLQKVEIREISVISGIVAVFKNKYSINYRMYSDGDNNRKYSNEQENFVLTQTVPTTYTEIPKVISLDMLKPSLNEWFDASLNRSAFISEHQASILKKDVSSTIVPYKANDVEETLLSVVKSRCKNKWRYESGSIKMIGSRISADPVLCKVNFNCLKWRYGEYQGSSYYNPCTGHICGSDLPVDEQLQNSMKKATKLDSVVDGLMMTLPAIILFGTIALWIFTPLRWYWALLIIFVVLPVFTLLGASAMGHFSGNLTDKNKKCRLDSGPSKI